MRIFLVCQRVPFPPDRGDKITTFNELRHLCAEHEVHVFCLADGEQDLENVPGALRYARSVTAVPRSASLAWPRALRAVPFAGTLMGFWATSGAGWSGAIAGGPSCVEGSRLGRIRETAEASATSSAPADQRA